MRRFAYLVSVIFVMSLMCGNAFADSSSPVAVGAKIGTLGGQVEITGNFSTYLKGRVAAGYLPWDYDVTVDDVDYDFNIKLASASLLLDLHPFAGGFRITAGAVFNSNDFSGSGQLSPLQWYNIGGYTFPGALVNRIDADVDFNTLAPYIGLGYSNAFTADGSWSFEFDAGVMYWGSPEVTLGSPNSSLVPGLSQALKDEAQKLEDELENFKFYPVVSVGVAYSF